MRTVDTMLVALPEVEVPAALAARLRMAVPTDHRSGRVPARPRRRVVAASLVAAAAVMIGVRTASDRTYREPNTQAAAALVAPASGRVGSVEMHAGRAPWIVMNLDGNLPDGEFHCDVVLADGTVRTIGRVVVSHGVGWWKGSLDVDPSLIDEVRVVAATGSIVAAARPDQSQRNAATS